MEKKVLKTPSYTRRAIDKYREKNKEKLKKVCKEYYQNNKEKWREYNKKAYQKRREAYLKQNGPKKRGRPSKKAVQDRDVVKAKANSYYQRNKEKINRRHRFRYKVKRLEKKLTPILVRHITLYKLV